MSLSKFLCFGFVALFALVLCSFSVAPVNALANDNVNHARQISHGHDAIVKRKRAAKRSSTERRRAKRSTGGRCSVTPKSNVTSSVATPTSLFLAPSSTTAPPYVPSPTSSIPPPPVPTTTTAVASAPSAPAPPAPAAPVNPSGSGKVGLAWNDAFDTVPAWTTKEVSTIYTWSAYCPPSSQNGPDCAPMLWGNDEGRVQTFQQLVVPKYAKYAMGQNEFNEAGQANLSPQDAANAFKQYLTPLANQGYTLISPSCSSASNAASYYQQFFAACTDCNIHALSAHYYGNNAQDLINYLTNLHNEFNMPIWLTEFADNNFGTSTQDDADATYAFLKEVIDFLESTEWIEKYFAFGTLPSAAMAGVNPNMEMMDGSGNPNSLGQNYINVNWP